MSYLVLVRHGRSTYNEKGMWTGWDDPELSNDGKKEAKKAGEALHDIPLDEGFSPDLKRCHDTLIIIANTLGIDLPLTVDKTMRERNYGDFTKKNKWEVKEQLGDAEFLKLRRSWDYPIPNGESLKQVYERIVPYFQTIMLPKLQMGENIIFVSSGNTLRALIKYLEEITDENIAQLEIATGQVYIYTIDAEGKVTQKEIRVAHENTV